MITVTTTIKDGNFKYLGFDLNSRHIDGCALDENGLVELFHCNFQNHDRYGRLAHISDAVKDWVQNRELGYAWVEIPFFTQNVNTAKILHEIASAIVVGLGRAGDGNLKMEFVNNSTWKSLLKIKKPPAGQDVKQIIKKRVLELHDDVPHLPDEVTTVSRGKNKGEVRYKVDDLYDAIAIATGVRMKHENSERNND